MLNLVLVGLNHRTAEVGIRERAAFPESSVPDALAELSGRPGIHEAMIISTCNRVEILCRVDDHAAAAQMLELFLSEKSGIPVSELRSSLYCHTDEDAVRHLVRVTCSLDSMIVGEPQVLGQVKSSYNRAVESRSAGKFLNTLVQGAFRTAKRVRSDTSIGEYSVSVSSAAVDLAGKVFGSLRECRVLIIGAGEMGEVAIRHLLANGARTIRVANRSPEAALALALRFDGQAVPYDQLTYWMVRSDVIIISTGAPQYLVERAMVSSVMAERKRSPIVFIDISVPRNVDPSVASIDNVFCYDIDDLGAVVEANLHERRKEAAMADRIVDHEVAALCTRLHSLDVTPVVVQVQDRIGEICRGELERYLRKNGPREPAEVAELESMIERIANKIAHPLVTHLRSQEHHDDHEAHVAVIKRMFSGDSNHEQDS